MKTGLVVSLLFAMLASFSFMSCTGPTRHSRGTPQQTLARLNQSLADHDLDSFLSCIDHAPKERERLVCLYELSIAIRALCDTVNQRFGEGSYQKLYDKEEEHPSPLGRFDASEAIIKTIDNLSFCYFPGGGEIRLFQKAGQWRIDSLTLLGVDKNNPYSAQTMAASRIMAKAILKMAAECEKPNATFAEVKKKFGDEMMHVVFEVIGVMNKRDSVPAETK